MPGDQMKAQRLKGFRDFLPAQMILRQRIIGMVRDVFERHGFAPLDTPTLEYFETLSGKYGDEERLLYHFKDQGDREVGLRYDLTVPLARVVGMHQNEIVFPFKRYHIAPVWRGENPQHGRYREFYQCDVDIVGSSSTLADAEILSILLEVMEKFGFPGYRVLLFNRKLMAGMARYAGVEPDKAGGIYRALDKLDKIGPQKVLEQMVGYGIAPEAAEKALNFATGYADTDNMSLLSGLEQNLQGDEKALEGVRELRQIIDYLGALTPNVDKIRIDTTLARGLDYYTGPIWEINVQEPKIGSLGGGGRYDGLVGMFSGRDLPTVGTSFGLERIIDVMEALGQGGAQQSYSQVLVASFNRDVLPAALGLLSEIRASGTAAEIYLNDGDKLGKQLQYADRLGIPFAAIVAPDELARGEVLLKDLKSQTQQALPREGFGAKLAEIIAAK